MKAPSLQPISPLTPISVPKNFADNHSLADARSFVGLLPHTPPIAAPQARASPLVFGCGCLASVVCPQFRIGRFSPSLPSDTQPRQHPQPRPQASPLRLLGGLTAPQTPHPRATPSDWLACLGSAGCRRLQLADPKHSRAAPSRLRLSVPCKHERAP